MPEQSDRAEPQSGRRLDLSMAQVAASALAAVVGAVLASELGVYGTIIGAAVVSVGATTGGAVFQHLFKRTGEQLRSAVDRGPEAAEEPRQVPEPTAVTAISAEWNPPQTVRARRRWTWRTYTAASALVFALAMTPIVIVEMAAGKTLHDITTGGQGSGTSFNPGGKPAPPSSDERQPTSGSTSPSAVPSSTPSVTPSTKPSGSPSPSTPPSASPSATPSTTPSGTPTSPSSPTPTGNPAGAATPSTTPTP